MVSEKLYKSIMTSMVRLKTWSLREGLAYIARQNSRKIQGKWVENVSKPSAVRLKMFASGQIKCVKCGLVGDHFHIERHKNDKVMPFSVNLYGWRGDKEIMLTWDHILPKSLGGSNDLANAQCMCFSCNSSKGNKLTIDEIAEIVTRSDIVKMYKMDKVLIHETIGETIGLVRAETQKLIKDKQVIDNI